MCSSTHENANISIEVKEEVKMSELVSNNINNIFFSSEKRTLVIFLSWPSKFEQIPTDASVSGFHQFMMRRTLADIFALRVDASAILAGLWALAFIYVGAVATGTIQLVTLIALAAKHAEDVLAMAEHA
jgi:hypothetical protein